MKKIFVRLLIVLFIILILCVLAVNFFLDGAVKRGIETVGPTLTKVDVKLDSVSLSLLSGGGRLKGLIIGNPSGYRTTSAIQVGDASLALQPGSVFSPKVIIKSINLKAPEITFETDLKGNNLSKILANLQEATGGGRAGPAQTNSKAGRKLQVDDFLITGGKIHVSATMLGGQSLTVPLPEIHLSSLGQGPDGITAAELAQVVLSAIEKEAAQVSASALANLGKDATGLTQGLSNTAAGAADKVSKGIGGFLKKN